MAGSDIENGSADENAETGVSGLTLLFSGFLTKQGRHIRSWRRRHFELTADGRLAYYKIAAQRKLVGSIDLKDCTQVIPGGQCTANWHALADPYLSFGIMTRNRRLHVFAETMTDLKEWLKHITAVVPEGVRVTTPLAIQQSWQGRLDPATLARLRNYAIDEDTESVQRVSLFFCGVRRGARVVLLPGSVDQLIAQATAALDAPIVRVYLPNGELITDISQVNDNGAVICAKPGEDFAPPPGLSALAGHPQLVPSRALFVGKPPPRDGLPPPPPLDADGMSVGDNDDLFGDLLDDGDLDNGEYGSDADYDNVDVSAGYADPKLILKKGVDDNEEDGEEEHPGDAAAGYIALAEDGGPMPRAPSPPVDGGYAALADGNDSDNDSDMAEELGYLAVAEATAGGGGDSQYLAVGELRVGESGSHTTGDDAADA